MSRPTAAVPARNTPVQASSSRAVARQLPEPAHGPKEENGQPLVEKSKGGNHFTKSERELLLESYDDFMDLSEDKIIDAWSAWAVAVSLQKALPFCVLNAKSRI